MEKTMKLKEIQQELVENGDNTLSILLSNALERQAEKNTHTIGFMGDDLVGKSTIINSILGENLLPTTIIPSTAETTIKFGVESKFFDDNGSLIKESNLLQHLEEKDYLSISINNQFLKDKSLIFKEFHGLLSKSKLDDMNLMAEVYKCDAVILVMTAEHLLSESENIFINNYIKYVGASHLLLVVNKLSTVAESDVLHIFDYAKNQIAKRFDDVKWTIFDLSGKYEDLVKKYTSIELKKEIATLFTKNQVADSVAIDNTLSYIIEQLKIQCMELDSLEIKNKEERIKEKGKIEKQKELEEASIESALIEFQLRRNRTIESVDSFIKDQFDGVLSEMVKGFEDSSNKYSWYANEQESIWRRLIFSVSEKVEYFATSEIGKDIDWLNDLLKTKVDIIPISMNIPEKSVHSSDKIIPYGTYKRYAPIGIAGGAVIGYRIFRIVGAAIGLGGGLLAYSYLGIKDSGQKEEMQRKLSSKIRDTSLNVRKLFKIEIEKIYAEMFSEFYNEAKKILEVKYRSICEEESNYVEKRRKIDHLINMIQEVQR